MNQPTNRLVSVRDAAKYIGVSRDTIYEYVRTGILPQVKLPPLTGRQKSHLDKILIDLADLDILISNGKPLQAWQMVVDTILPQGKGCKGIRKDHRKGNRKGKTHRTGSGITGSFLQRWKTDVSGTAE